MVESMTPGFDVAVSRLSSSRLYGEKPVPKFENFSSQFWYAQSAEDKVRAANHLRIKENLEKFLEFMGFSKVRMQFPPNRWSQGALGGEFDDDLFSSEGFFKMVEEVGPHRALAQTVRPKLARPLIESCEREGNKTTLILSYDGDIDLSNLQYYAEDQDFHDLEYPLSLSEWMNKIEQDTGLIRDTGDQVSFSLVGGPEHGRVASFYSNHRLCVGQVDHGSESFIKRELRELYQALCKGVLQDFCLYVPVSDSTAIAYYPPPIGPDDPQWKQEAVVMVGGPMHGQTVAMRAGSHTMFWSKHQHTNSWTVHYGNLGPRSIQEVLSHPEVATYRRDLGEMHCLFHGAVGQILATEHIQNVREIAPSYPLVGGFDQPVTTDSVGLEDGELEWFDGDGNRSDHHDYGAKAYRWDRSPAEWLWIGPSERIVREDQSLEDD